MLAGLNQVRTIARAVERHFALLATTLGADAPMDSEAETLLLTDFTDGAAQMDSCIHYGIRRSLLTSNAGRHAEDAAGFVALGGIENAPLSPFAATWGIFGSASV
jgi:hypothetical protein